MPKFILIATVALVFPMALLSQTTPNNSFAGTWKLDVAKSKFNPGPALKSETLVIPAAEGKVEVQEVTADGKEISWSYTPPSEGSTGPIDGVEGATVSEKRTGDRVVDHNWEFPNFTGTGHGVLSKNGKIMTYTMTGSNEQGKRVHNVSVFEKQ